MQRMNGSFQEAGYPPCRDDQPGARLREWSNLPRTLSWREARRTLPPEMTSWAVKAPAPCLTPSGPTGSPHLLSSYCAPGTGPGWRQGRHLILQTVLPLPTESALRPLIHLPLPKLGSVPSLPGPSKQPTPIQYPCRLPTPNKNRTGPSEGGRAPQERCLGCPLSPRSLWPHLSR